MSQKLRGSMPQNVDLGANYQVAWAAVDPTTGADVAGVTVSNVGMLVTQVTPGSADELQSGAFVVPTWMPIPNDQLGPDEAGT